MVVKKIADIDPKELKKAQGVLAFLDLLGISEEDLQEIKNIPAMKAEISELREFKEQVLRTIETKTSNTTKTIPEVMKAYSGTIKEFDPHYGRN